MSKLSEKFAAGGKALTQRPSAEITNCTAGPSHFIFIMRQCVSTMKNGLL